MLSKKRIIAGVLAVIMAFGLTACSKKDDTATKSPTKAPTQAPAAGTPDSPADNDTDELDDGLTANERGLSKYETPVTVTYARNVDPNAKFAPGQDYENNIWMTEYEDVLGINLVTTWEAEGLTAYDEKLNLSIVSGTLPDMFACNTSQLAMLIKSDLLEDLTDALENYGTDFYKENLMADDGVSMDQATVNGKLYSLPKNCVVTGANQLMFIRDDWRVALGLPEPKTMDDMLTMAKAFVENDPDGNGLKDTYGFGICNLPYQTWFTIRGIFNCFGAYPMTWIEKNGKLEFGEVQPEMKTALAAMHQWYVDGLIDPEFVTKDDWALSAEAGAGRVGIAFAETWLLGWPLPDYIKLGQEWRAYQIPFDSSAPEKKYAAQEKLTEVFVVRKGCENPEALIKMCNLFQDRVMSMNYDTTIYKWDNEYNYESLAAFGPVNGADRNLRNNYVINQAIDKNDPSIIENIDQQNLYDYIMEFINGSVTFEEDVDRYTLGYTSYWGRYGADSIYGLTEYQKANDMYKIDKFYGAPTPAMQEYEGQLKSDATEMMLNIITGVEEVNYFDTFVERWYANGGQQITDEVNEWYQEQ